MTEATSLPDESTSASTKPVEPLAFLWDGRPDRADVVRRVAASIGVRVLSPEQQGDLAARSIEPGPPVGLLAMGADPRQQAAALAIARGRERGCVIIGYEDGVSNWSLGLQSRALLSGAIRLLDSAREGFEAELAMRINEVLRTAQRQRGEEQVLRAQMLGCGIVGASAAMLSAFAWVARISQFSDFSVLLQGETGTGKDLLARTIHQLDPRRRAGPFVAVNCAALPKMLSESELFGHRKGAFTGADAPRRGLVRAADGGVLFLDEIGELDLEVQAKLLRVLQEGRVLGLGEEHELLVNVRVVSATHRDLEELVARGQFREDLLHRLQILSVRVPPLRERREDIPPLVALLVERYRTLAHGSSIAVGSEFLDALMQLELPGNVRQLENIVRHAVASKEDGGPLGLPDLPVELWRRLEAHETPWPSAEPEPLLQHATVTESLLVAHNWNLARTMAHCERLMVEVAMRRAHGNQSQAARLLGITPRSVYNKLHRDDRAVRRR